VSNLLSGLFLLLDRSIKPGDVVEVGDTFGWVKDMRARYVGVITRNNKELLIPNDDFVTNQVINWSHSDLDVRMQIEFGVAYSSDPHEVRRLATEAATEAGGARLHASSGQRNKTRRAAHVNMLRLTTEALAAALGGVDSMSLAPFDAPLGLSDAFSRRLARNLQLILQEELPLCQLIDPAGGAWHIENLTDQLSRAAWARFQKIEAAGGLLAGLQAGRIQADSAAVAEKRQADWATGAAALIGNNLYADPAEAPPAAPPTEPTRQADASGDSLSAPPLPPLRLAAPFEANPG